MVHVEINPPVASWTHGDAVGDRLEAIAAVQHIADRQQRRDGHTARRRCEHRCPLCLEPAVVLAGERAGRGQQDGCHDQCRDNRGASFHGPLRSQRHALALKSPGKGGLVEVCALASPPSAPAESPRNEPCQIRPGLASRHGRPVPPNLARVRSNGKVRHVCRRPRPDRWYTEPGLRRSVAPDCRRSRTWPVWRYPRHIRTRR